MKKKKTIRPRAVSKKVKTALRHELVRRGHVMPLTSAEVAIFEAHLPPDFDDVEAPPAPTVGAARPSAPKLALAARNGGKLSLASRGQLGDLLREMRGQTEGAMNERHFMFLAPRRELRLDNQAQYLATEFGKNGRVEPEAIAKKLGIAFRYHPFPEEFDGVLMHDAGKFYIVCNDRKFPRGSPRSRFTFAHELGHALIGEHAEALRNGKWPMHFSRTEFSSREPIERDADVFAAGLLMPRDYFWDRVTPPFGADQLCNLSDIFGASMTAVAYRALRLGLLPAPAAVIRWDALGRRTGRSLSLDNGTFGRAYWSVAETPPRGSATARAVEVLRAGILSSEAPAAKWFPAAAELKSKKGAVPIREEVISLGSYGWLTLLSNAEAAAIPSA